MRGQHGQRVRADLVGRVAVRSDAVRAGDDAVDLAGGHQRCRRGIGDDGVRDPGRLELPGGQPRALKQRPGLVHPHVREQLPLPGRAQGADGAAVAPGREPARVAVRQRPRRRGEQLGRVSRHRTAALDLLLVQPARMVRRRVVAHLRERPREVHRRRSRRSQQRGRGIDVVTTCRREREPVRRSHADRRRAANRELANRDDELVDRRALELDLLVRQATLVEEDDLRAVLLVPNDVLRV